MHTRPRGFTLLVPLLAIIGLIIGGPAAARALAHYAAGQADHGAAVTLDGARDAITAQALTASATTTALVDALNHSGTETGPAPSGPTATFTDGPSTGSDVISVAVTPRLTVIALRASDYLGSTHCDLQYLTPTDMPRTALWVIPASSTAPCSAAAAITCGSTRTPVPAGTPADPWRIDIDLDCATSHPSPTPGSA